MHKFQALFFATCLSLFASAIVRANIDVYEFSSEEKREQYNFLTHELRCPKCQNQDIADSNAPIAKDMRREVHRMIEAGKSNESIVSFMVERFGEFVSYRPRVTGSTYLLWYGPLLLALLGIVVVVLISRKRRSAMQESPDLEPNEKERLRALLEESGQESGSDDSPVKDVHTDGNKGEQK